MSQIVNEKMVQEGLARHIGTLGWIYTDDDPLGRPLDSVFLVDDLEAALIRLNPEIAEQPSRAE